MERKQSLEPEAIYRDRLKCMQILLSNGQAGPGRKVKQEQEEISRNHVQAFILGSVHHAPYGTILHVNDVRTPPPPD